MSVQTTVIQSSAIRIAVYDKEHEVGHGYVYLIFNELHEEPYALFEDVFVEEEARGKGIGTKLVEAMIDEAKKQGCYKITAQSRYEKPELHAWYTRLGFKDYGKNFRMTL